VFWIVSCGKNSSFLLIMFRLDESSETKRKGGRKSRPPTRRNPPDAAASSQAAHGLFNRFLQLSQTTSTPSSAELSRKLLNGQRDKTSPELSRFGSVLQGFISKEVASLHKGGEGRNSSVAKSAKSSAGKAGGKKGVKVSGIKVINVDSSEEERKDPVADTVDVGLADESLTAMLLKGKNRKRGGGSKVKKCGKCAGCKQRVCGICAVCQDNPRFGGRWEHHKKKGCIGTVLQVVTYQNIFSDVTTSN
jgi:hypothetical protein